MSRSPTLLKSVNALTLEGRDAEVEPQRAAKGWRPSLISVDLVNLLAHRVTASFPALPFGLWDKQATPRTHKRPPRTDHLAAATP